MRLHDAAFELVEQHVHGCIHGRTCTSRRQALSSAGQRASKLHRENGWTRSAVTIRRRCHEMDGASSAMECASGGVVDSQRLTAHSRYNVYVWWPRSFWNRPVHYIRRGVGREPHIGTRHVIRGSFLPASGPRNVVPTPGPTSSFGSTKTALTSFAVFCRLLPSSACLCRLLLVYAVSTRA